MKIAIMQPYFFPYLGYFSLIKNTDKFIILDSVQFIRHGWIERNRILCQENGWIYIQVPLIKHNRETLIKDIIINNQFNWKQKIISQIQHYKKTAPYFYQVKSLISKIFENQYSDIVSLNRDTLLAVCNYLGIIKEISIFSQLNLIIDTPSVADEWALNICKKMSDVTEYWNPTGGKNFFNKEKYINEEINLKFHSIILNPYEQKRIIFEPGLSIIDVMMFNSPEEICKMLDQFELV